jgi:hypothetical protein
MSWKGIYGEPRKWVTDAVVLLFSSVEIRLLTPELQAELILAIFMAEPIAENDIWNRWKGQMPVINNKPVKKNE